MCKSAMMIFDHGGDDKLAREDGDEWKSDLLLWGRPLLPFG